MNAVQHFTVETREETQQMVWKVGEVEGFDSLSEEERESYQDCFEGVIFRLNDRDKTKISSDNTYSVRVEYNFKLERELNSEQVDLLSRLTVTRMRGTFSPEETTEDIVFALDDTLVGGFGAPKLEDDSMLSFYEEGTHSKNRFQARYIIIDADIDDQIKKCSKVLGWSVHWTNPSPGAFDARPMSMTKQPKFSIKQLRRLIKNEKQAKLDL